MLFLDKQHAPARLGKDILNQLKKELNAKEQFRVQRIQHMDHLKSSRASMSTTLPAVKILSPPEGAKAPCITALHNLDGHDSLGLMRCFVHNKS